MEKGEKSQSNHFSEKVCSNDNCLNTFIPKTYNGVYCSPECRRESTNKKPLEKYHDTKKNKFKKKVCATPDCTTILSSYNKERICEQCKVKRYIARLVSWGWNEERLKEEF